MIEMIDKKENIFEDEFTSSAEALKDIYWYIKGAIDQSRLEIGDCSFDSNHTKSLLKAIELLQEKAKKHF